MISVSLATITTSPENVLVLPGEDAVLKCSTTDTAANTIVWRFDGDLVVTSPCTPHSESYNTTAPNPATDCNLIALAGTGREISGPYLCNDKSKPKAVATVISLSK